MKSQRRKIGVGSFSLLLFLIAFILVIGYIYFSINDEVLFFLGRQSYNSWDAIDPMIVYLSFIFTIPSIIIGYVFDNNFGSRAGRSLSLALVLCIVAWIVGYFIGTVNILPKF